MILTAQSTFLFCLLLNLSLFQSAQIPSGTKIFTEVKDNKEGISAKYKDCGYSTRLANDNDRKKEQPSSLLGNNSLLNHELQMEALREVLRNSPTYQDNSKMVKYATEMFSSEKPKYY